jgi:hypothetical protein
MRDIPMRDRKPKKRIEADSDARTSVASQFSVPNGEPAFKDGYRECISMFALHAPNKRGVARILDEHCITLEQECLRTNMAREAVAQYEGYRQAMKDLKRMKKMK